MRAHLQTNTTDLTATTALLEAQIRTANNRADSLEVRLAASENQTSYLQSQLDDLRAAIAGLAVTTPTPAVDQDDDHAPCSGVDSASNRRPAITADAADLEITACSGGIHMHSRDCAFDACAVKQDVIAIKTKLEGLSGV